MARYVDGDTAAFSELFGRFADRIYGFFVRTFGDRSIADDLLQRSFLKFHASRRQFQTGRRVKPWIFTIAARVRLDELRRLKRNPESEDVSALDNIEPVNPSQSSTPTHNADERAAKVRAAIEELPDGQRAVIHLHKFEGFTFAEIAEILGCTEGAAKLRAFRAYEQLRHKLRALLQTD